MSRSVRWCSVSIVCVLVILGLRLLLIIRSFKPCYSLDFDSDCNKSLITYNFFCSDSG